MSASERDRRYMRMALRLAARGRGRTSPNPHVGAVVVGAGDTLLGKGYHRKVGAEHGEIAALAATVEPTEGAELFVNLEPCCHQGRTGPCTRAIIQAGIRRVVVGMKDPNPLVNGKGIRALRRAGVEVCTGVLEQDCQELNAAFICYMQNRRPLVTFKSAVTLDGKVATRGGHSRWVTGAASRKAGHRMRDTHDAIAVGVGTVLGDDPTLTCREVRGGRDPVRVVVDSRLRTPVDAKVMRAAADSAAPTLVVTSSRASARKTRALTRAGAEVLVVDLDADGRHVDVGSMLSALAERGLLSLLLEGGPRLAGAFWRAGLVDRMAAFVAPKVLGDARAMSMVAGAPAELMSEAVELADVRVRRMGRDVLVEGKIQNTEHETRSRRRGTGTGAGE